ncbi:MAG: hypothetical protein ACOCRO_04445 [Halanaerobiales bacterium]
MKTIIDDVHLNDALYKFKCNDCGDRVEWELIPDPDSLYYIGNCSCEDKHWEINIKTVSIDLEEEY